MPNILVEAMFYDCARISTNCITGPQELISDGVDGFLINVDDEEEYARKLQSLINDEQLRLSFCERAKVRCDEFSPEKNLSEVVEIDTDFISDLIVIHLLKLF